MACTMNLSIETSLEQIYFGGNTACPDKQSFWFILGLELARCFLAKVLFSSFPIHFLFSSLSTYYEDVLYLES
jgi:hypothetical protein